jgi:hypothetical protein
MRRRKLLATLAAGMVLAGVAVFVLWPRPDRITRENFDRITKGMSRAEVHALLGPPGDYRTVETEVAVEHAGDFVYSARVARVFERFPISILGPEEEYESWLGNAGDICVFYGPDGVSSEEFATVDRVEKSVLDGLLWRAKRQWRRWFPQ